MFFSLINSVINSRKMSQYFLRLFIFSYAKKTSDNLP